MNNLLLKTDVYKMGHMEQYVPGCNKVYSYLQARTDKEYKECVFFGLQYYLKNYLSKKITMENVEEYIRTRENILNCSTSSDIRNKLEQLVNLGYLPIKIKAIKEGTKIPIRNVLVTITNTNPNFYWLVGFIESLILKIWYPINVATISNQYRLIVDEFFDKTVEKNNFNLKEFTVHDFGYRSTSSEESAIISGISHLVSFTGSDNVPAYKGAIDNYDANPNDHFMTSVPASEHSVMCSFGRDGEFDAFSQMLDLYPTGIVSIVSDTYNIWKVLTEFLPKLKQKILSRDGKVIFRPDSGNPEYIICGNPNATPGSSENLGCMKLLEKLFGSTKNSKNYTVLNSKIGIIYGEKMTLPTYRIILTRLMKQGYSACNLVIGVGTILRTHNRDTLGFAVKATKVEVNGIEKSIMKDPITDRKKKSHQGYLNLFKIDGKYVTNDNVTKKEEELGLLETVFLDGKIVKNYSLNDVKNNLYG